MDTKLSIVITSKNDTTFFKYLIFQISRQTLSKDHFEVHFLESGDKTKEDLKKVFKYLNLNLYTYYYPTFNRIEALNFLINQCNNNLIVRLDTKTRIKNNYLQEIIKRHQSGNYVNVGGSLIPIGLSILQRRIARLMKSRITFGGASFRDKNYEGYVKSVYLGSFNKKRMKLKNWFDEKNLYISEDSDLNFRLYNKNSKSIYMDPKIKSYYLARENLSEFFKLCFNYGRARAIFVKKHRQFTGLRQILPLLFYSIIIFLCLSIFVYPTVSFSILLLIIRETVLFKCSSIKGNLFYIYGILGCHFLWSLGFIRGCFIKIKE